MRDLRGWLGQVTYALPHPRTAHTGGYHQVSAWLNTNATMHQVLTRHRYPSIRNRLTALKKNRGEYIKASDVNVLYQAIVKQGQPLSIPCVATLINSLHDVSIAMCTPHRSLVQ